MRNRIAGIMHWEDVGIEHAPPKRPRAVRRVTMTAPRREGHLGTIVLVTLVGAALALTLRALFGAPSARA